MSKHTDLRSEDIVPPDDTLPLSARAVRLPERAETKRTSYGRKRTVSQQVVGTTNCYSYFGLFASKI